MRSLTDWFEVVWFRRKVVAMITAIIVALMAIYLIFAPRTYLASASLYFDKSAPDPLKNENNGQQTDNRLDTEAEVIRSSKVVKRVVKAMPASEKEKYRAEWSSQRKSGQTFDEWLNKEVLSGVTVTTQTDAKVLEINAVADNPKLAADLANNFASGYIDAQHELTSGPAQAYAKFLSGNLAAARQDVERAEGALSSFVKATGVSGNTEASAGALASTVSQLAGSQAAAAGAANMGGYVEQGRADAENTETVQRLNTEYATKAAQVSQLEATLGPNHPTLLAAEAELKTIKARLSSERASAQAAFTRSRQAALAAESAAAAARAGQLQSAANAQRSQLVQMSSNLGKFATLQQDLSTAQQRYNELSSRASQMQLRGALPLANVSQLDAAQMPDRPTNPKVGLLSMLAIMMGLFIGAGVAILLEYLNPRVRTLANVEKLIGVPVIARLSLPRETPLMLTDASAN